MSAIFGIINKKGEPVQKELASKATSALAHRAKDGWDEVLSGNIYFGFAQLKIYPEQEAERILASDGLMIAANAHLHNRESLARQLGLSKPISGLPDSHLILEAYKKWGVDCAQYLDGEYVYAIWDSHTQQLFLSIDHIGYKPMYYYDTPEQFIFSSEIKAIEAVKTTPNYFDEESLVNYIKRNGDINATYNKEIKAMCGGNSLFLKNGSLGIKRYWNIQPSGKYSFTKDEDWYECLRDLFYKAIENRLNPDRKIGISLSGGLDSSSIACVLSDILRKKNKPLYAFSVVLPESYSGKKKDEAEYIRNVSEHCGNIINFYESADGLSPLDNVERSFAVDEWMPFGVHFMNFALLERASKENIDIMYNGLGGDFWLSSRGDMMIWKMIHDGKWKQGLSILKKLSENSNRSFWQAFKMHYFVNTSAGQMYFRLRSPWKNNSALLPHLDKKSPVNRQSDSDYMMQFINSGGAGRVLQRVDTRTEFFHMGAAHPGFDRSIMEFLADVPLHLFVEDGRQRSLFRNAMKGVLPEKIRLRPDKTLYVVNTTERLGNIGHELEKLLSSENEILYHYFSKERIEALIKDCRIARSKESIYKQVSFRASQVLIAHKTLHFLHQKNFYFA